MTDKLDEELKLLSAKIAELSIGKTPQMFLMAVSMAAGVVIKNCTPRDRRREVVEGVAKSIMDVVVLK